MLIPPLRLLLADDHQLVVDSLKLLFATLPDVVVVGTANDSRDVPDRLTETAANVLLCDLHMPHLSGLDLAGLLRKTHPQVRVLLLTMADGAATIRRAVLAGVAGYVLKQAGRDELEAAMVALRQGQPYFSPTVLAALAQRPDKDTDDLALLTTLTARELDVLRLIADELPTNLIAERLFISPTTVETHRRHLMQKLGVKSVVGMVKFAMKNGLAT
jgi:DNA-binding NarL/FixJ family response regulator